jgi:hypothetical protein
MPVDIYKVDKNGFTVDGYYLGVPKGSKTIPDAFKHPGPLPQLTPRTVRALSPLGDQAKKIESRRIASFDEAHAEEMRRYYGNADGTHDGARITWANPIEPPEPPAPKILTPEEIAVLRGEETLRKMRG